VAHVNTISHPYLLHHKTMMALRPAIAKKQKDEKLPLAIKLIHFNFYLSGGVCAISILIGRLGIREATDTIYITSATPSRDLSWSPPTTVHDRWRRFRGCTPGMRGVPRDKLSGNGGIRYSFRCPERQAAGNGGILTLFVLPSGVWIALYLSSFLPKKLYCHSTEVLGMTMIVVFILAENRSSRGWRFLPFNHHETIRSE
jgi:hypothetical protein